MALSIASSLIGIDFPNAYVRLFEASVTDKTRGHANLVVYSDDTTQHVIGSYHIDFTVDPAPDAPNIHTQAYTAAKLLPELAGAVDV